MKTLVEVVCYHCRRSTSDFRSVVFDHRSRADVLLGRRPEFGHVYYCTSHDAELRPPSLREIPFPTLELELPSSARIVVCPSITAGDHWYEIRRLTPMSSTVVGSAIRRDDAERIAGRLFLEEWLLEGFEFELEEVVR